MAWTNEQLKAINEDNNNIIVSAGAGSGKTAVLTERVIRKLKDGTDVDKLLVLTFTNEAANEMKNRIRDAIIKNKLEEQLALLDSAYITTFDSFALSIVKKYHYLLNIKHDISIIDSNIILIYKNKVIDEIFEDMYGNPQFNKLIDDFCQKDDKNLKLHIIELSEKLDLLIDKNEYLNTYQEQHYNNSYLDKLTEEFNLLIQIKIQELMTIYHKLQSYITHELDIKINQWLQPLFSGKTYDEYVLFNTMTPPRFTKVDEAGKIIKENLKEKIDEIQKLLRFKDTNEIKNNILSTSDHSKTIIEIIKKLDIKVSEYKRKFDIYEFNDIAHMAIDVVKNNPEVKEELKYFFNEIMVDEYQDTSSIQEEFINLISNNNVYMVGDIKQSIYRFRNANPYIFQNKYDKYSMNQNGIKIDLLKNFRSRKETLHNINEIFNIIMDNDIGNANYLETHNMVYGNTLYDEEDTQENNNLEIYNYSIEENTEFTKEEKELFIIAEDIINKIQNKYQVFDKKTGKLRDIKYSDICIITDRNKHFDTYKKILEYKEIPSVLYKDEVLTNDDDILVIKNLINLVAHVNEKNYNNQFKYLFTSVSRSFLFEYNDNQIYQIFKNNVFKYDEIIKKCQEIDIYQPLTNIIINIIDNFEIYEKLTKLPDIDKSIIRIENLLNIATSLSKLGYNINDFVAYIDDVIENGLNVKYSVNTGNTNAVKIMNIHKSKGLEFSLCYFTGMHNKFTIKEINDKILFSTRYGIILPYKEEELKDTILKDLYVNNYFIEEISEKIRLFYVALTRCREKMIIVTSLKDTDNKYTNLVPAEERIKYRSFLDILNSINIIEKYVTTKEAAYNKEYDTIKIKEIISNQEQIKINKKEMKIKYDQISNKRYSKQKLEIISDEEIKAMEYGTKMHEELEYSNIEKNEQLKDLLSKLEPNYINIYREYEFIDEKDNEKQHGIIDLIIEYSHHINIIDYKLKNINDKDYIKQLNGYKKHIENITKKDVNIYLYSLINKEIKKI